MNSLADLFNSPAELAYEGTTYKLRQPTLEECGQYQRWLEAEARAGASRATELPEADRQVMLREAGRDIAKQVYAWGGEACVESLRTPTGLAKLVSIVCADQGVTHELARKMCEARLLEIAGLLLDLEDAEDDAEKKAALARLLKSIGRPPNYLARGSSSSPTPAAPPPSKPSAGSPPGKSSKSGSSRPATGKRAKSGSRRS
jgi:hypothetical protein